MRNTSLIVTPLVLLLAGFIIRLDAQAPPQPQAQTQAQAPRRPVGSATFAVAVADPAGAPIGSVKVILQGPAKREARTENGRIAFENLPLGTYRFRFERDGFVTFEREVVGRAGAPIDVKVTLTPAPEPPKPEPPPEPVAPPPPPPSMKADPVGLDISAFLDTNFVGRAPAKNSNLACSAGGTATLMQFREGVPDHTHATSDEYLYVIAGAGIAQIGGKDQPLSASVFVQIPRGMSHALTVKGKNPLIVLSIKAGEPCAAPTSGRTNGN